MFNEIQELSVICKYMGSGLNSIGGCTFNGGRAHCSDVVVIRTTVGHRQVDVCPEYNRRGIQLDRGSRWRGQPVDIVACERYVGSEIPVQNHTPVSNACCDIAGCRRMGGVTFPNQTDIVKPDRMRYVVCRSLSKINILELCE